MLSYLLFSLFIISSQVILAETPPESNEKDNSYIPTLVMILVIVFLFIVICLLLICITTCICYFIFRIVRMCMVKLRKKAISFAAPVVGVAVQSGDGLERKSSSSNIGLENIAASVINSALSL